MHPTSIVCDSTRIIPIKKENQAVKVTMQPDRSMVVELASGKTFTLAPSDKDFQAFVVYAMLNSECNET